MIIKKFFASIFSAVLLVTCTNAAPESVLISGGTIGISLNPRDDAYLSEKEKECTLGIGTLTFFDPETGDFGALGHGIADACGTVLRINGGEVLSASVVAVKKGEKGNPGELQGIFLKDQKSLGEIKQNTPCGIFGKMTMPQEEMENCQKIKVGTKDDVRIGKAYILANTKDSHCEKFEIEITKIPVFTGDKTKGMVIKITDKTLLAKTGGIVRGMSGCPIVQSGRLVGAITHVFVNDPTLGYGIFIEDMLAEAQL